jgi:Hemolysin coregulated protein Hcp (TssD)
VEILKRFYDFIVRFSTSFFNICKIKNQYPQLYHKQFSIMAHTGKFELDGKKADLVKLSYQLGRDTDDKGKPSTRVRKCLITVTIASDDALKNAAIKWMEEGNGSKSGKKGSVIINDEEEKEFKKIGFENGFVVDYKEEFSYGDGKNVQETFTISAETVTIGDAKFDFKWPKV